MMQFDKVQSFGKDNADAAMRSLTAISNGAQTAAVEATDFLKRSFEEGTKVAERLMGARTLNAAVEIQGDFLRTSYENLVAQATRVGELTASTAKAAFAPVEGLMNKPVPTA